MGTVLLPIVPFFFARVHKQKVGDAHLAALADQQGDEGFDHYVRGQWAGPHLAPLQS